MRKPEFYSAVYWIIKNEKWEVLFQIRQNTWLRDWFLQLPAWHIEWTELLSEALIRELDEEIGIKVTKDDIKQVHVLHRIKSYDDIRVYFDCYFEVNSYTWDIVNLEPEKCSEIKYIDINNIKEEVKKYFWYDLEILKKIENWEYFSEIIL
jgi:ADP-ribose pyrophosphatase YjhB (NUDIX family)